MVCFTWYWFTKLAFSTLLSKHFNIFLQFNSLLKKKSTWNEELWII